MDQLFYTGAEYAEFSINNPEEFSYMADFAEGESATNAVQAFLDRVRSKAQAGVSGVGNYLGDLGSAVSIRKLAPASNTAKLLGLAAAVPLGYGVYAGVRGGISGIRGLLSRRQPVEQEQPKRKILGLI